MWFVMFQFFRTNESFCLGKYIQAMYHTRTLTYLGRLLIYHTIIVRWHRLEYRAIIIPQRIGPFASGNGRIII